MHFGLKELPYSTTCFSLFYRKLENSFLYSWLNKNLLLFVDIFPYFCTNIIFNSLNYLIAGLVIFKVNFS